MTDYAPFVRIALRYLVGAGILGSHEIGEMLAADPDLVMAGAAAIGAVVEVFYIRARRKGGST